MHGRVPSWQDDVAAPPTSPAGRVGTAGPPPPCPPPPGRRASPTGARGRKATTRARGPHTVPPIRRCAPAPPPSTAQNHPPQGASPPPNQATPPRGMHGAQGGAGSPASPTASLWWCTCAKEEAAGGTEKRAAAPRSETKPLSKPNRPEQCVARETVVRTVPGMEEEVSGGGGQKNGKGGEGCRMASSSGQREWNSESTTPIPIKGVWVAPRNLMSPPRGHPLSGPQWNAEPFRSKR